MSEKARRRDDEKITNRKRYEGWEGATERGSEREDEREKKRENLKLYESLFTS
jgi:hypothetical protein